MTIGMHPPKKLNDYFFRRHGVPMTFTAYTVGAADTYGIEALTPVSTTIDFGIISYSRRSLRSEDMVQGSQYIIEAEIYLLDDDFTTIGLNAPLEPDTKRPEVLVGAVKYDIFEIENPKEIGIVRFICRKKRGT